MVMACLQYSETEFEIWTGFGPQFRCHEFTLHFITNFSRINETGKIDT